MKKQYRGPGTSLSQIYCDIRAKVNNMAKFREIVMDGNLQRLPETQQSGHNFLFGLLSKQSFPFVED